MDRPKQLQRLGKQIMQRKKLPARAAHAARILQMCSGQPMAVGGAAVASLCPGRLRRDQNTEIWSTYFKHKYLLHSTAHFRSFMAYSTAAPSRHIFLEIARCRRRMLSPPTRISTVRSSTAPLRHPPSHRPPPSRRKALPSRRASPRRSMQCRRGQKHSSRKAACVLAIQRLFFAFIQVSFIGTRLHL